MSPPLPFELSRAGGVTTAVWREKPRTIALWFFLAIALTGGTVLAVIEVLPRFATRHYFALGYLFAVTLISWVMAALTAIQRTWVSFDYEQVKAGCHPIPWRTKAIAIAELRGIFLARPPFGTRLVCADTPRGRVDLTGELEEAHAAALGEVLARQCLPSGPPLGNA